jgi:hypothetical protein
LRRASEGGTFTVLLQNPRTRLDVADLIWCLAHENVEAANVISTLTTPHIMRPHQLATLGRRPAHDIDALRKPLATVLLGGPDAAVRYDGAAIDRFGECLHGLAAAGASFLIASSQRTTTSLLRVAREATCDAERIVWAGSGSSRYWTFLAQADLVIVTGDSVSMTSEACVTGKPVYVFETAGCTAKLTRFHSLLRRCGATRPLTPYVDPAEKWSYRPLDAAPVIAAEIARRFRALRLQTAPESSGMLAVAKTRG